MSGDDRLAQRLRALRVLAGLSQERLAERSGLGVRTVRNLECGRVRMPHPDTIRRLADALELHDAARAEFISAAGRRVVPRPAVDVISAGDGDLAGTTAAGNNGIAVLSAGLASSAAAFLRVPAQLPAAVPGFTGRGSELAALSSLLVLPGMHDAATMVTCAIAGMAGVGKTALALHWAHQAAGEFPDGQLYVNLRGYDAGEPVAPTDALAGFLYALGMAGRDIPPGEDQRAAAYRSLVAGRRMLLILDNAREVRQVRPLLPGSPKCAVIVTSRDSLAGLVAREGARRLDLDPLPPADAVTLLQDLIGEPAATDPDATLALATQCGRLPLALRVAAELATARPAVPLAELAADLTDRQRRLDLLDSVP